MDMMDIMTKINRDPISIQQKMSTTEEEEMEMTFMMRISPKLINQNLLLEFNHLKVSCLNSHFPKSKQ